jgi:integrase
VCGKCGAALTKFSGKSYWIEYYLEGRRKRERIGPNKRAAEARLQKVLAARAEGRALDIKKDRNVRFDQLVEWYLDLPEVKAKRSYDRDVMSTKKLKAFFGTRLVREITPALVEAYRQDSLKQKNHKGQPNRPATVNREVACLKTIFSKAVKNGKVEQNPCLAVRLLKEDNLRTRLLSPEEFEKLHDCATDYLKPILVTAYYTGMRRGEILDLRWDRVDLKEGFIRLKSEDTKTSQGRAVPLNEAVLAALKGLVRCLHHDFVFTKDKEPVGSIRQAFENARSRAGLTDFHFHDLRHTCINNWRLGGHDYFRIMAASGHKTMAVFKRYNAVTEEELKRLNGGPVDTYMDTRASGSQD